ncbi:zinc finger protein 521 [Sinocyclocheilus anshuiensis]|uniref:zinc finger protein 521 n=1 Tax=Sinocyclocheilus anshuiensis TaxID=1608454 RepID=UPI0007B798D3|nr:PREDICTED: zinc finger protein 521-like [Sinocyclocheilus anshuiensis]
MSRRKQAKPRSLKGQDGEINTKEDSMIVGKKRCSWERRKEKDEERERIEKEKDEDAKEHKCATLQQAESFTQQRLKYCRDAANHNVEKDEACCLALPLSPGPSSSDHEDGCDLGFKGATYKDNQRLGQCGRANIPLPGNSSVPLEISQKDNSSETFINSKQGMSNQYEQGSVMSFQHLSLPNNPPNNMEDTEKRQPPNCAAQDQSALSMAECTCATSHMPSPATANTEEMAFRTMAPSAEKRKSHFDSNSCLGITKKLKAFNNCVHCHNHMNPRAHPQPQDMENKISSSSEILTFPSDLSEHQKETNVMLGHSVLLEAAITAAVQTVLQCSFCPTSLKDLNALQEHVRQSHNSALIENNVFFCSQCFRGFLTKDTLDNHVQQTHCLKLDPDPEETAERKSLIFCPYCTHLPTFNRKLKLMQHIKKTHKNINLMNLKDGRMTMGSTSPQSIKSPAKKTALPSTDFICDHCGAKYNDLDLFQTHLSSHLKSMLPKRRCPECFKDFPNHESFKEHTVSHFSNTSTLYICESCSKTFTSVKDLHGHLLEMHTIVFYRCSLCQKVFSSKMSIQVHLASEHSNKRTTFQCTSCERDFKEEHDLHLHVKEKHLDKQCKVYCCIFCAESFTTDIELQCHITTHSDKCNRCICTQTRSPLEVPLHEKLCAKSQSAEGNNVTPPPVSEPVAKDSAGMLPVNSEIRDGKVESLFGPPTKNKGKANLNDPMFACEICGASYTMQSLLANHQLRDHHIQPGESGTLKRKVEAIQGSHKCKDCSKTFFTEMALWEHVQTHLGPTKHCQCPICGERFPSLLTLTEHKVTHSRSLDTGNCRICKLPLHSEEDFLEHCQRHPDLHNSLTGFRCVVCMQTVTSTLELKIHGTFHMQKVQGDDLISSCTDPSSLNPDLKISSSIAQQETVTMTVNTFEHKLRDSKTCISVVNCCSATALIPEERGNKNTLTQTSTV